MPENEPSVLAAPADPVAARRDGGGHGPDFVQSLERGLAVIRAFGPETPQLTLSEVARATGLTRAAARRFLLTLTELGYVRADGRSFSLRPRILELGFAYLSGLSLPETAQPHMEELVAKVHESCSVSVLDGDEVVYVARVPTRRIMLATIAVGTRFPAYATSMGRVLLAGLPQADLERYVATVRLEPLTRRTITTPDRLRAALDAVRLQGYAMVDQELEDGLRSIAAPIRDAEDRVIAAINVSSHASRATLDTLRREYFPLLRAAADQIEADLRVTGHRVV
jgi:IclR family transcriptional regulator, pca regulon regulatory protein